jgi:hypothetical protein
MRLEQGLRLPPVAQDMQSTVSAAQDQVDITIVVEIAGYDGGGRL